MLSVRLLHIDLEGGPVRHIPHRQIGERRRVADNLIRADRIRFRRREPRYAHIDAVQGFRWPNLQDCHPSTTAARPARRSALCSAPVGSGSPSVSVLPSSFLELIQELEVKSISWRIVVFSVVIGVRLQPYAMRNRTLAVCRNAHWVKAANAHSRCDIMRGCSVSGACLDTESPNGVIPRRRPIV